MADLPNPTYTHEQFQLETVLGKLQPDWNENTIINEGLWLVIQAAKPGGLVSGSLRW